MAFDANGNWIPDQAVNRAQGGNYIPSVLGGPYTGFDNQGNIIDLGGERSDLGDAPFEGAPPVIPDPTVASTASQVSPTLGGTAATNSPKKPGSTFGGINAVGVALGAVEAYEGLQGLKQLSKTPFPEYTVSTELQDAYSKAQDMAKQGYTPQERAAFLSTMGQNAATNSYYGRQVGGGSLASAVQAGVNSQQSGAFNQFAAQDAELHRENLGQLYSLSGQVQNQRNLKTQADIQRRIMQEQAYGGALNQGLSNIGNNFNLGAVGGSLLTLGSSGLA